ncbi:sperm head and tail associated protein-like [Rattus rattus]|uniref:sperm head and tail associated protein-like n=1 Tax=Rattus rattus TaxID=10117 RepID=UPI0013F3741D|nr:sperm head and tail associated protein-like [Rattus rattus]
MLFFLAYLHLALPTVLFPFPSSLFPFPFSPMTSSPPFLLKISTPATAPQADCPNNYSFPPASPSSFRKGFTPVYTVQVPVAPGKEFSDHLSCTAGLSPNAGNRFTNPPFPCLTISSPCLPRPMPTPPPPPSSLSSPPAGERCSFEPFSPLLGRLYSQEPTSSSPSSPCFDRFSLQGPPSPHQRGHYCNCIGSPEAPRSCPQSPRLCYVTSPPLIHQPPRASPVTSPQLTHIALETGPVISTPLTSRSQRNYSTVSPLPHRPLRTGLPVSSSLPRPAVETRPLTSANISHRVLETGPAMPYWSSGRSYNDPPLSSASSPPSGNPYHDHPLPPDSCEPKPQLDVSLGKNCCGPPLSSQAVVSGSPISPQEGCIHYSHLCPDSQISVPRSPYCVINLPPESADSPSSSLPQALHKPCLGSFLWEPGGNSYLILSPGTVISGPPCPTESSPSQYPYPSLYFPAPPDNQSPNNPGQPPKSPKGYNKSSLPTPVTPQTKPPKSLESRRAPCKCRSLVNTPHHTPPNHPKSHKTNPCPQPPSQPFGLSSLLMEPSITTTSNSGPKELPRESAVLKTAPTSCPHSSPCNPALSSRYPKSSPQAPPPVSPCNTHMYSVVPPTSHLSPLSSPLNQSTHLPNDQHVILPCGTYSAPRGPPPPYSKPVAPPCSTHIYSFIPLRTPFDPRCLPIVPRARFCSTTIPCGVHTYAVTSPSPPANPAQIPYSCPFPSSKSSSNCCSTSASSTIVCSDYQSSDNQSNHQNKSQSQSKSSPPHNPSKSPPRRDKFESTSRSRSHSPPQNNTQDCSENAHTSAIHHKRSWKQSSSAPDDKNKNQSKSSQHGKNSGQIKSPSVKKK